MVVCLHLERERVVAQSDDAGVIHERRQEPGLARLLRRGH